MKRRGRWLERLRFHQVALLLEIGPCEPSDHGPIVLLIVVYVVWIALRARQMQMQDWLRQAGELRCQHSPMSMLGGPRLWSWGNTAGHCRDRVVANSASPGFVRCSVGQQCSSGANEFSR